MEVMSLSSDKKYKILLERSIPDLFLRKTSYMPGDWSGKHFHENARFVFVLKGKFVEKYERRERFCQPFTCIFRPPLEKHSETYSAGVVCLSVDISPSWLKRLENYSINLNTSNAFLNRLMPSKINKICSEMITNDGVSALAIDTLITEFAIETYRNSSVSKKGKSPRWLKIAIEFIDEHFSSNLTLNEIASIAGIHPVHLARVFKRVYHCTIADYIRELRIKSARQMLLKSNLSLAQIAFENGFTDQSHFTKIFKRLTDKTPAEYKSFHKNAN
jgi:AraC family transcriptional regulator